MYNQNRSYQGDPLNRDYQRDAGLFGGYSKPPFEEKDLDSLDYLLESSKRAFSKQKKKLPKKKNIFQKIFGCCF
jgi:hypothetical protein